MAGLALVASAAHGEQVSVYYDSGHVTRGKSTSFDYPTLEFKHWDFSGALAFESDSVSSGRNYDQQRFAAWLQSLDDDRVWRTVASITDDPATAATITLQLNAAGFDSRCTSMTFDIPDGQLTKRVNAIEFLCLVATPKKVSPPDGNVPYWQVVTREDIMPQADIISGYCRKVSTTQSHNDVYRYVSGWVQPAPKGQLYDTIWNCYGSQGPEHYEEVIMSTPVQNHASKFFAYLKAGTDYDPLDPPDIFAPQYAGPDPCQWYAENGNNTGGDYSYCPWGVGGGGGSGNPGSGTGGTGGGGGSGNPGSGTGGTGGGGSGNPGSGTGGTGGAGTGGGGGSGNPGSGTGGTGGGGSGNPGSGTGGTGTDPWAALTAGDQSCKPNPDGSGTLYDPRTGTIIGACIPTYGGSDLVGGLGDQEVQETEIDLAAGAPGFSAFGTTTLFASLGSAQCPTFDPIVILGNSYEWPLAGLCEHANIIRAMLMISALLAATAIVFGGTRGV